jgi:hypothetical protein
LVSDRSRLEATARVGAIVKHLAASRLPLIINSTLPGEFAARSSNSLLLRHLPMSYPLLPHYLTRARISHLLPRHVRALFLTFFSVQLQWPFRSWTIPSRNLPRRRRAEPVVHLCQNTTSAGRLMPLPRKSVRRMNLPRRPGFSDAGQVGRKRRESTSRPRERVDV